MSKQLVCSPKVLPRDQWVSSAQTATDINPVNHPPLERLVRIIPGFIPTPEHIAVLTTKYWHSGGVRLTVGFLDNPPAELRSRILSHMNAWNKTANVQFTETSTDPQVRIARAAGNGYWSYLGTDILSIAADQPTMNLEAFTMSTPESEFHRVVRHETGHTLGFPHEHMRQEIVDDIDPAKAITFFGATQGWTPEEVRQQVLTPIETSSLLGTAHADPNSIMCYQIPGSITKDGNPIIGGLDIDQQDYDFVAKIYPKPVATSVQWASRYIDDLTAQKIVSGFQDGTFHPDDLVTRVQFAAMIAKAFASVPAQRSVVTFRDVPASYWGLQAIQAAYQKGYMSGYPDGTFRPDQQMPRVQVLVSLVSGLGLPNADPGVLSFFQDANQIPAWASGAVAAATNKQLVINYPQVNQLNPKREATRAEVAAFIYQALVSTGQMPAIASPYLVVANS